MAQIIRLNTNASTPHILTFKDQKEWDAHVNYLKTNTPKRQMAFFPETFPCVFIVENGFWPNNDGADYVMGAFLYGELIDEDDEETHESAST